MYFEKYPLFYESYSLFQVLVLPHYRNSKYYSYLRQDTQSLVKKFYMMASSRSIWAREEQAGASYLSYIYGTLYSHSLGKLLTLAMICCDGIFDQL